MSKKIKLQFDAHQEHQLRAVNAVVNLFEGLLPMDIAFQMGDDIVANLPPYHVLEENWLFENLRQVQDDFNAYAASIGSSDKIYQPTTHLQTDDGVFLEGIGEAFAHHRYPSFTVDMETGTGKTYVYLRTIMELKKHYGFRKFIIIVPSVAIYEGVIKSFEITKEHFKSLYGNETIGLTQYDGQQISKVRNFATSGFTEIMVMTLDSFNKTTNLFYKSTEKLPGEKRPFEYVQDTRPILILDESQNYRSAISRAALRTLKPLFALNYSATPGTKVDDSPNVVFKLNPVDAFRLNLVKKIQVWGIQQEYNVNNPQLTLALEGIHRGAEGLRAKLKVLINQNGKLVEGTIEVKKGDKLFRKTRNNAHLDKVVSEIDMKNGFVGFEDGDEMHMVSDAGTSTSLSKHEVFRYQIEKTILEHFARQKELKKHGVKILSLFFIDRVANYVEENGIIKKLFDEVFEKLKSRSEQFKSFSAAEVREGYFASKKTKSGNEFVDTAIEEERKTVEHRKQEKAAYELIMKGKEKLLNFDEKVCFLFAHSALREGWDNPNVFQICTLNASVSENKKRQEIGRGLRLCVNQNGERVIDEGVNILTVVANESYRSYVEALQKEYKESGDLDYPTPSDAAKTDIRRNEKIFKNSHFRNFWDVLCKKTTYTIHINTNEVVKNCLSIFNKHDFHFPEPKIVITKGRFVITTYYIELLEVKTGVARLRLNVSDTEGTKLETETALKKGADLSLIANRDERLKPFKIVQILGGEDPEVKFGNGNILTKYSPVHFQMEKSVETDPRLVQQQQEIYPVFNLIDRASKELSLTRSTILEIFKGIEENKKKAIFKNPEGFSAIFIEKIREQLADEIANKIEYSLNSDLARMNLEEAFPDNKKMPQKELIDGTKSSIYNYVQIDSDLERRFIQHHVQEEDEKGNLVCYFKFPNTFKINIPKIIGNYNPDWGIIRLDENGKPTLKLVRETKGNTDTSKLRFSNEGRKIECAEKHFGALGIDFRTVDDRIETWWLPTPFRP